MRGLLRRVCKLEAANRVDSSSLIPYSKEWLAYWEAMLVRVLAGDRSPDIPLIPIDASRAVVELALNRSHEGDSVGCDRVDGSRRRCPPA